MNLMLSRKQFEFLKDQALSENEWLNLSLSNPAAAVRRVTAYAPNQWGLSTWRAWQLQKLRAQFNTAKDFHSAALVIPPIVEKKVLPSFSIVSIPETKNTATLEREQKEMSFQDALKVIFRQLQSA